VNFTKLGLFLTLTSLLFVASITPVLAVDRNSGVSVGDYVKYKVTEVPNMVDSLDWSQINVTDVSPRDASVTLLATGQFKNGTTVQPQSFVVNFGLGNVNFQEYIDSNAYAFAEGDYNTFNLGDNLDAKLLGYSNGEQVSIFALFRFSGYWLPRFGPMIAANLKSNDVLWNQTTDYYQYRSEIGFEPLTNGVVNSTETRTYLGVDRIVNVINVAYPTLNEKVVYDKSSGLMLEMQIELKPSEPNDVTLSAVVIETNIFNISPSPSVPEFPALTALFASLAIAAFATVVYKKSKLKK
jgi:hypothetical protein